MAKYISISQIPDELQEKLGDYFTNVGGDTFVISGLPAELTGGMLARYSRARTGIQLTLVNEFLDEDGEPSQAKGSALMNRVLNAFGDDSVGELEGTHVGMEGISQVLTKEIEDRRIGGSPIEQSTRYVLYDEKDAQGRWRYLRPREIMGSGLGARFEQVTDRAFEVYCEGVSRLKPYFREQVPRDEFTIEVTRGESGERVRAGRDKLESDAEKRAFRNAYNFTIRCAALDVGRCILPSSALTQLGIRGNGRFYTHLLTHMKSSELAEANDRGAALEDELAKVIPTYIKRNACDPKRSAIHREMRGVAQELFSGISPEADSVLLARKAEYGDEVLASALFAYTNVSMNQILDVVTQLPDEKKLDVMRAYRGLRESRRDRTGRGLEAGYPIVFDLVGGFAEYRDLERHRMLTQQRQELTGDLGFIMPPEMGIVGLESEIEDIAGEMSNLNSDLRKEGLGPAAQYATLFNNRLRWMMGMNLRAFQHMAELRSQPAGHHSYRAMTMEMVRKLQERDPFTAEFLEFVDFSDPGNKISRAHEQARIAGKNLAAGVDGGVDLK